MPREDDLAALFAPLLAAPPTDVGAGPTPPPPGQRLAHILIKVRKQTHLERLTVDGLLALGRALPALTDLRMEAVDEPKGAAVDAKLGIDEACRELMGGLRAVGRGGGGGGGGGGAEAEADAPTPGGPPPTFSDLLLAVRAALARLAAAQGA